MENPPEPDMHTVIQFFKNKRDPIKKKLKDPIKNAVKQNRGKTKREHQNWQHPDVSPINEQLSPKKSKTCHFFTSQPVSCPCQVLDISNQVNLWRPLITVQTVCPVQRCLLT